jgi:hypothetical protein
MEFREYAASEVSALIDRLVSDADGRAAARLADVQQEHDAALVLLRVELATEREELEERAAARAERLQQEHDTAMAALRAEFAADRQELEEQAAARVEELQQEHDAAMASLRLEFATERQELEEQNAAGAEHFQREHDGEMAALRAEFATERQHLQERAQAKVQLATQLEEARVQADALRAAFEAQSAALEAQRAEAETHRAEAEMQRAEAEAQRSLVVANLSAQEDLIQARSALDASQAEVERLTRQFDSALEELRLEHVNTLQQQALERTALPLDELLSVFAELAKASTPSAVLKAVVTGLAHEFSRVALFRLRGSRLECVTHEGFAFEGNLSKIVVPTAVDSLLTRAISSKRTHSFLAGISEEPCAAPFGGTPACALAMPLVSGDATVAVIYADDSDQLEFGSVPGPLLVKFAEIVWQHAILVLHRASAAKKALAISSAQSFDRPA